MLVIGKRGAAGLAPENTLEALKAGRIAGCDILHIDVRLTRDGTPVLHFNSSLKRTHGIDKNISQLRDIELSAITVKQPVPTLESVLDRYFGKTLLMIELRSRGSAQVVTEMLKKRCGDTQSKWDNVILASYKAGDLLTARRISKQVPLAMMHDNNPFSFIAYHRIIKFTAVGFHRLHTNRLAHQIAKKAEIFTFTYTVNRPQAARLMEEAGYDGVVTNFPDRLIADLSAD